MKLVFIFIFLFLSLNLFAKEPALNIEHQIRLCDEGQLIFKKLFPSQDNSSETKDKKYKIYYIETKDHIYESLGWSIRARVKSKNTEITIKKKSSERIELDGLFHDMICEYDLHGSKKTYSCKLSGEVPNEEFQNVIMNNKKWTDLLSSDQYNFLQDSNLILKDAVVYGMLDSKRVQWKNDLFGLVTLDLVYPYNNNDISFHELSIRYPAKSGNEVAIQFENFVKTTGIKTCKNQIDWLVNKFEVLDILN